METMIVLDNGEWWKFEIPASAGGCIEFIENGYEGRYYAIQDYKDGEVIDHVTKTFGGGPPHTQRSGKTNAAYLVWQSGEVIKGKRVKLS
jgi:hypothetical protein